MKKILMLLLVIFISGLAAAAQPTKLAVYGTSEGIADGNIGIRISTGESCTAGIIFDQNYTDALQDYDFNVLLGSAADLNMNYNQDYYMCVYLNDALTIQYMNFRGGQGQIQGNDLNLLDYSLTVQDFNATGDSNFSNITVDRVFGDVNFFGGDGNNFTFDASTGNVGIGTATPETGLNIAKASDSVPSLTFGSLAYGWQFYERLTDGDLQIDATNALVPKTVMYLDRDTGRVGIKTAPAVTFHIKDTSPIFRIEATSNSRRIDIVPSTASIDGIGGPLMFNRFSALDVAIGYSSDSRLRVGQTTPFSPPALLYVGNTITTVPNVILQAAPSQTADIMLWRDSSETGLGVIDADGNVGIGTSVPTYKLNINGDSNFVGDVLMESDLNVLGDVDGNTFNTLDENTAYQIDGATILRTGTAANSNMFLGEDAFTNDEGMYSVGVGYRTGYNNDHVAGQTGYSNIYIGERSGYGATGGSDNTGYRNVGVGRLALYYNTSGYANMAIGMQALYRNTTGVGNMAIGYKALYNNAGGEGGVAIGSNACLGNTSGIRNIGIGANTLFANTDGHYNLAIGNAALYNTDGADHTVAIGISSGFSNTTGSDNIFLGYESGYSQTTNSNLLIIDNQKRTTDGNEAVNSIIYGTMAATPADQVLRINADVNISGDLNVVGEANIPATYMQASDVSDQSFAATGTPYSIELDTIDENVGVSRIEDGNILIRSTGIYYIAAQPQVTAAAGQSGVFHMWLQEDTGGGFVDIDNSNIELSLGSQDEDVILLIALTSLAEGNKIRIRASVSNTGITLDTQSPAGEPVIPSIIFSMYKIGV